MAKYIHQGFTLIEILVTLAIVAILASVAYPSYQESVRKAKRAEARAALMQSMQQQERYYSQNNSYIAFSLGSADPRARQFKSFSGESARRSAYEIRGEACAGQGIGDCVILTATAGTANVDSAYNDPTCRSLTLASTGTRTPNGCW